MDTYIKEMAGMLFSKIKASKRSRPLKFVSRNSIEHFQKFFSIYNLSFQNYWHSRLKLVGKRYQASNHY